MDTQNPIIEIDPNQFQFPVTKLALTMSLKVEREGTPVLRAPNHVAEDIGVLLRVSNETLNLLCYINADERVKKDCTFKSIYTVVALPLVRNMIDNLYNITYILEDPSNHGRNFRLTGIKKRQRNLKDDEERYSGRTEWDSWIRGTKEKLSLNMRHMGATQIEVDSQPEWRTLGRYISDRGEGTQTDNQRFFKLFMLGRWREYSALAHGGPESLLDFGMYFLRNEQPFEDRTKIDENLDLIRDQHMTRAYIVLLSTITELQVFFHFQDANIDSRLSMIWNAIMLITEAKELYDERYAKLMKDGSAQESVKRPDFSGFCLRAGISYSRHDARQRLDTGIGVAGLQGLPS